MNAREYILSKQIQWAYRNNIMLIGSKGDRGKEKQRDGSSFDNALVNNRITSLCLI